MKAKNGVAGRVPGRQRAPTASKQTVVTVSHMHLLAATHPLSYVEGFFILVAVKVSSCTVFRSFESRSSL